MDQGIPVLTAKGREALERSSGDLSALCRNVLVQVDGKKSVEEVRSILRGLKGLDEALQQLFAGSFIEMTRESRFLVNSMLRQVLGAKASTLTAKIEDLHDKYGDRCWDHLDEVDKLARLFYGEIMADRLKQEITKIVKQTGK